MTDQSALGPWVKRFLLEYLPGERNFTRNTQQSYRDALRLLIVFAAGSLHKKPDQLLVDDIRADLLRKFMRHIEEVRKCSVSTRNQRLAAIHALATFIGERCPEYLPWCAAIRAIVFKRGARVPVGYLEKNEIDALLDTPDNATWIGTRDRALLLFMYNSGARASETAQLTVGGLRLHSAEITQPFVELHGKGNKIRFCPLWASTAPELKHLTRGQADDQRVFLSRYGKPLTRFGIHDIVTRHVRKLIAEHSELRKKRIGPHTIRHTTATHLLRAGVDINTIRAWLGHVSIETTNVYAEIDLEMKAKALKMCEAKRKRKRWRDNPDLLAFLAQL
jgi:site-specific recombinase XerD